MPKQSTRCIVCGNTQVEQFLDLGSTPLANKFLSQEKLSQPEPSYPLRVGFCHNCHHVELTEAVPPSAMFDDYLYISSASDTLKAHLFDLSDIVSQRYYLDSKDLVIDIGCNDGTLLSGFKRHGVKTLGVDPAQNLAVFTEKLGIPRHVGFFNSSSAKEIAKKYGPASAITATNTFPHIPELQDFIRGLDAALAPDGVFVIEAHYLIDILDQGAFDTIYHEHVSYWALGPMRRLFEAHRTGFCCHAGHDEGAKHLIQRPPLDLRPLVGNLFAWHTLWPKRMRRSSNGCSNREGSTIRAK